MSYPAAPESVYLHQLQLPPIIQFQMICVSCNNIPIFLPLPWPHWCWMETWLCSPAHPSVVDTAYHQTPEKIHSLMWTQEFCKCVSTEQISLLLRANYNLLNVDVNCYRVPSGNGSHLVNCCDLVRHDSTADWQRRRSRRQTLAKRTFIEWSISHGMGIEQTK